MNALHMHWRDFCSVGSVFCSPTWPRSPEYQALKELWGETPSPPVLAFLAGLAQNGYVLTDGDSLLEPTTWQHAYHADRLPTVRYDSLWKNHCTVVYGESLPSSSTEGDVECERLAAFLAVDVLLLTYNAELVWWEEEEESSRHWVGDFPCYLAAEWRHDHYWYVISYEDGAPYLPHKPAGEYKYNCYDLDQLKTALDGEIALCKALEGEG